MILKKPNVFFFFFCVKFAPYVIVGGFCGSTTIENGLPIAVKQLAKKPSLSPLSTRGEEGERETCLGSVLSVLFTCVDRKNVLACCC